VDVRFRTRKLEKCFRENREAARKWGVVCGRLYVRRINEIQAAPTMADLFRIPGARCHPLKGPEQGRFAVDLEQPYRLIFEPSSSSGEDPGKVTEILIIDVVDYHG